MIDLEPLLTTADVSRVTGRAISTLEKDRLAGNGPPFVKIGPRTVRYRPSDVRAWLEGFRTINTTREDLSEATTASLTACQRKQLNQTAAGECHEGGAARQCKRKRLNQTAAGGR